MCMACKTANEDGTKCTACPDDSAGQESNGSMLCVLGCKTITSNQCSECNEGSTKVGQKCVMNCTAGTEEAGCTACSDGYSVSEGFCVSDSSATTMLLGMFLMML